VADLREHGEGGLDEHVVVPGAAWAALQIGQIALLAPERGVGEDDHALGEAGDEGVEGAVVDVGGIRPQAHTNPHLLSTTPSLPPTIQRWLDTPLRPMRARRCRRCSR